MLNFAASTATSSSDFADPIVGDGPSVQSEPVDESISTCVDFSDSISTAAQIQMVENNPNCAEKLVQEMLLKPAIYLDAFYALIESPSASEPLWWAVFQQVRADEFRFSEPIVADFHRNLGEAIARCTDGNSCSQWQTFILPALEFGELYRCPELSLATKEDLLAAVRYGDYYCVEAVAQQLAQSATLQDIKSLFSFAQNGEIPWSRRNAIRVIGRMAEQPGTDVIHILVSKVLANQIEELMLNRLSEDPSEDVLLDAIWILDTFYHPVFDAQPLLTRITRDEQASPEVRFRAIASITRLIQERESLRALDMIFLEKSLGSADPWVRGYAAFAIQSLQEVTVRPFQERRLLGALEDAFEIETEFSTKAAIAQSLDNYNGSELLIALKNSFEEDKLAQKLSEGHILVRSGLMPEQIPPKVNRMQVVEQAFFDIFDQALYTPTPESDDPSLELLLFASQLDYQAYMDAFVGYGSDAGGLYLESDSALYTYEREPDESRFTVEHLIEHEYTHYLMGRYVFPGIWSDPGYHDEPKGWIDEGTAEYFAELELGEEAGHAHSASAERLLNVCDNISGQRLQDLITQRAGYDEPGTFDYDLAWSFVKYLFESQPTGAQRLLQAYRNETYKLEEIANILGSDSLDAIEADWRSNLRVQCADLVLNTGGPTTDVPIDELLDPTQPGVSGPKRYDEPVAVHDESFTHEIITIQNDGRTNARFGGERLDAPPPPRESDVNPERFIRLVGEN